MNPQQKSTTYRNPKYIAFVESQPCIICGRKKVVAHHESGLGIGLVGGGMSKKCSDLGTVPLCCSSVDPDNYDPCHRKRENEGYITFWVRHGGMVGESPFSSINRLIADGIAMREIIKLQSEWIERTP